MFIAQISFSQTITEAFNYTAGANLINSNSKWSSPLGSGNSLTIINESFVNVGSVPAKSVRLSGSSSSEQSEFSTTDLNGGRVFRDTEGEILYVALAVNVNSAPTGSEYFANVSGGLNQNGDVVNARGRMYVRNVEGNLAFGVSWGSSSSSPATNLKFTDAIYDFNRTYILVLKFLGSNKNAQLFVFNGNLPATEPQSSTLSATSTENPINGRGFVIRHTSTSQNMLVGGIIASTSWPTGMTITKSVLPINLIAFKAVQENSSVRVNWSTASEKNNDRFEILKSTDGINFNTIGTVNGSQNSSEKIEYTFLDKTNSTHIVYYKLKQVDNDGTSTEFPPVVLKLNKLDKDDIIVFKDNDGKINATFIADKGLASAGIYAIDGNKITEIKTPLNSNGQQSLIFNDALPAGVYIMNLSINNKSVTCRFIL